MSEAAQSGPVAEMNYGRLRYGWDDPRTAPFVDALDHVNRIAERSAGFVWMLDPEAMERAQLDPNGVFAGDPRVASTLSVWRSVEDLRAFVFDTLHGRFLARGREWFEPAQSPNLVIWPVAPDHRPSMDEAMARLRLLESEGPSAEAFDWAWIGARASPPNATRAP